MRPFGTLRVAQRAPRAVLSPVEGRQPAPTRDWRSERVEEEEPAYSQQELAAVEKSVALEQTLVRGACMIAWGIGLAALFVTSSNVMSIFFGIVIVAPILAPLVYLVLLDGRDWLSENPKLAIPISLVGLVFSACAVLWAIKRGGFGTW